MTFSKLIAFEQSGYMFQNEKEELLAYSAENYIYFGIIYEHGRKNN